jgi:hypothetical protein
MIIPKEKWPPTNRPKGDNMLTIEVPKLATFHLPEGEYQAVITGVRQELKQNQDGAKPFVRMLFDVTVPDITQYDCKAGRSLPLNMHEGSELWNFLAGLLGADYFRQVSGKKINLEALAGMKCLVTLVHYQGNGHKQPMVVVSSIRPLGRDMDLTKLAVKEPQQP